MSFGNFPFVKVHRIWWEPQVNNVGFSVFLRSETCLKILSIWKGKPCKKAVLQHFHFCATNLKVTRWSARKSYASLPGGDQTHSRPADWGDVGKLIGEFVKILSKELRSPLLAKRPSSSTKQHQHFESQEQDKAKQELLVHKCIGEMKGRSCIHKTYVGVVVAFAALRFVLPNVATQHMSLAVWSLGSACTLDRNVLYS